MNWLRRRLLCWLNLPDVRFYSGTDRPGSFLLVRKTCELCQGAGDRFVRYGDGSIEICWRCHGSGLVWDIDPQASPVSPPS